MPQTYLSAVAFIVSLMVQIVDREQELMSTAGLQSLGGGAGLGRGGLDRELRIVPSMQTWLHMAIHECLHA